jgi:hypothetical protein
VVDEDGGGKVVDESNAYELGITRLSSSHFTVYRNCKTYVGRICVGCRVKLPRAFELPFRVVTWDMKFVALTWIRGYVVAAAGPSLDSSLVSIPFPLEARKDQEQGHGY